MRVPAPLLVLGSAVSVQTGQAFGKGLFAHLGPAGVVALRLGFAAAVLLAIHRPPIPPPSRLFLYAGFGTSIAGMNLIYPALRHIPLGIASAIQLLGPLTVAVFASRRPLDLFFAALAGAGVWLCHADPVSGPLPVGGLLFAFGAAAAMGTYLLLSRRAGAGTVDGGALAWAVTWAAALSFPFAVAENGVALPEPGVLLAAAGVAVLSAVLPYSLEFAALRRLPAGVVAVLVCLEPAVAGIAGMLVLSEDLALRAWIGIACVTSAAVAVTVRSREKPPRVREK